MKTFITSTIMFAILALSAVNSNAQEKEIKAFAKSYTEETEGEYTKAINTMKAVYSESSYEINLRLGWLNYMAASYTEAQTYYQKAISLMPYAIEAKFGYALPAAALGNWNQVHKQYEEILKIDANNTQAHYRIGMIDYSNGEYQKAFTHFEKVANLYPFDYDSALMLAWTNYRLNKFREAKVLFNKVLMMSPEDESALEGLSLIK